MEADWPSAGSQDSEVEFCTPSISVDLWSHLVHSLPLARRPFKSYWEENVLDVKAWSMVASDEDGDQKKTQGAERAPRREGGGSCHVPHECQGFKPGLILQSWLLFSNHWVNCPGAVLWIFGFYPESCSEWLFYLDPPQAPRNWERSKYIHLGILVSILGPFTVALWLWPWACLLASLTLFPYL